VVIDYTVEHKVIIGQVRLFSCCPNLIADAGGTRLPIRAYRNLHSHRRRSTYFAQANEALWSSQPDNICRTPDMSTLAATPCNSSTSGLQIRNTVALKTLTAEFAPFSLPPRCQISGLEAFWHVAAHATNCLYFWALVPEHRPWTFFPRTLGQQFTLPRTSSSFLGPPSPSESLAAHLSTLPKRSALDCDLSYLRHCSSPSQSRSAPLGLSCRPGIGPPSGE
jgi:hypothetical protein